MQQRPSVFIIASAPRFVKMRQGGDFTFGRGGGMPIEIVIAGMSLLGTLATEKITQEQYDTI